MLKSTSKFKQYVKEEYHRWARAMVVMTPEEREAFKGLFKAVLSTPDSTASTSDELPSDIMFMLMLVQLKAELNKLEEILKKE